ncbi:hypothetical protein [Maricaulis sp.]|uniref:hypothetical protein n=1 Tax=Maricaulis sp. TaxID=1486257 RepID=UPI001B281970|nr:hypothetical protein [Maricaulis sp.]MBO6797330.1 hypothetical protein [Maricaulis sp.]
MKSKASILSLIALVIAILMGVAYLVAGVGLLPEMTMSRHGWIALGLGTFLSVVVGGGLAAILIISRRDGYDEAAHEVFKKVDGRED